MTSAARRVWLPKLTQAFLLSGVAFCLPALAGIVQGTVTGVPAGTKLTVLKGTAKVTEIVVQTGGGYSVALDPGAYTVACPGGGRPTIQALNQPVVQDIGC